MFISPFTSHWIGRDPFSNPFSANNISLENSSYELVIRTYDIREVMNQYKGKSIEWTINCLYFPHFFWQSNLEYTESGRIPELYIKKKRWYKPFPCSSRLPSIRDWNRVTKQQLDTKIIWKHIFTDLFRESQKLKHFQATFMFRVYLGWEITAL